MKFAVVGTGDRTLIISELWLEQDDKICKYPNYSQTQQMVDAIKKHEKRVETWDVLEVLKVHGKFGN